MRLVLRMRVTATVLIFVLLTVQGGGYVPRLRHMQVNMTISSKGLSIWMPIIGDK